ncbi:MAG: hypothetical protein QM691_10195 [Opitutaceae bacterium]
MKKAAHYCTYFDTRYAAPGVALWLSLRCHDPGMTLWVLALDDATAAGLRALEADDLRVLTPEDLERADSELARSRATRSALEHLFTFSPCLPRYLLRNYPAIGAVTYIDADIWFCESAEAIQREWGSGSVYVTRHDLPAYLQSREMCFGTFNVGILGFRNDANGLGCLDWWRERCLEWCKDVPELGRYADQKYLDEWPKRFGGVVVSTHPGINAAPWNWQRRGLTVEAGQVRAGGEPLIAFHFAQLRRLGPRLIDTSQSEFGVMPFRLRAPLYGSYVKALDEAERLFAGSGMARSSSRPRSRRRGWLHWAFALLFGTVWLRLGGNWFSSGFGLGRYSGRLLASQRRWRGRPA